MSYNANLTPQNIKSGVNIGGVVGSYETMVVPNSTVSPDSVTESVRDGSSYYPDTSFVKRYTVIFPFSGTWAIYFGVSNTQKLDCEVRVGSTIISTFLGFSKPISSDTDYAKAGNLNVISGTAYDFYTRKAGNNIQIYCIGVGSVPSEKPMITRYL